MNWLRDILGICRRHHISNQWDGLWLTYICQKCFNEGRYTLSRARSSEQLIN